MLKILIIERVQPVVIGVLKHLLTTPSLHNIKETNVELISKNFFILKEIEKINSSENIYVNIYGYYISEYDLFYHKQYKESFRELTRFVKSKFPFRDSLGPNRLTNYDVITYHTNIHYLSFYSNNSKLSTSMTEKEYYKILNNDFIYNNLIDMYNFSNECVHYFENNIQK